MTDHSEHPVFSVRLGRIAATSSGGFPVDREGFNTDQFDWRPVLAWRTMASPLPLQCWHRRAVIWGVCWCAIAQAKYRSGARVASCMYAGADSCLERMRLAPEGGFPFPDSGGPSGV